MFNKIVYNYIYFLSAEMEKPRPFGLFHLFMLAIIIPLIVLLVKKFKNADEKQNKKILLWYSIIFIILEIHKQLILSINKDVLYSWSYDWSAFPFALCSTPMYIAFIVAFLKEGKVKKSLYSFLATFGMFAGAMVLFYPESPFSTIIFSNIHTLIHHGGQVFIGAYLIASKRVEWNYKTILNAIIPLVVLSFMALGVNMLVNYFVPDSSLNAFELSPYGKAGIPLLDIIQANFSYPIFFASYIIFFTGVSYAYMYFVYFVKHVFKKSKELILKRIEH